MLRGLLAHGLDARGIAARQHFSRGVEVPGELPVEVVDVPRPSPVVSRLRRLVRPRGELAWGEFAARVREAASEADVVHLVEIDTAWCARDSPGPRVFQIEYLVRRDRDLGPVWRRQFGEVAEFAVAESLAVRAHRFLVANSPLVADEIRLRKRDSALVEHVPLALVPEAYPAAALDGPPAAGIIGTAGWPTTAASMRRLAFRVWPLVRRRCPEARLLIAGRGTDLLRDVRDVPGVEVLGEVPSSAAFLRGLRLLLFPLERGSGTKVKVLEAMACGVPVVTTPAGAEGIVGTPGVVVRSGDDELAAAAVGILRDDAERKDRGAAARAAFGAHHTPVSATRPLVDFYRQVLARS